MKAIPAYALYGEVSENLPPELLHCESIADLVYTFIDVKAIALSPDFSDAVYFSRFFSKHKRCTPTHFGDRRSGR